MRRRPEMFEVGAAVALAFVADRVLVSVVRAFKVALFDAGADWYQIFMMADLPAVLCSVVALVVTLRYLMGGDERAAVGTTGLLTMRVRPVVAALLGMLAFGLVVAVYFAAAGVRPVFRLHPERRLLYVLIWPVFTEELLYRGFMLRLLLERLSARQAIAVSAMLFAASHHVSLAMSWSLPDGGWLVVSAFAQLVGAGLMSGWLYVKGGGCLAACMIAHLPGDYGMVLGGELAPGRSSNWWLAHGYQVANPLMLVAQAAVVWIVMRGGRVRGRAS